MLPDNLLTDAHLKRIIESNDPTSVTYRLAVDLREVRRLLAEQAERHAGNCWLMLAYTANRCTCSAQEARAYFFQGLEEKRQ